MPHPNPGVAPAGRRWLGERIATDARPIAHIAAEMGISRTTA
ncbi:MAG TPA: IS481 family transposase, partial [Verrucomicrobiae bacterium]|nr:IS481 family transposase [Verrucomicrobiae bacterium]